jgi:hypothetical protein
MFLLRGLAGQGSVPVTSHLLQVCIPNTAFTSQTIAGGAHLRSATCRKPLRCGNVRPAGHEQSRGDPSMRLRIVSIKCSDRVWTVRILAGRSTRREHRAGSELRVDDNFVIQAPGCCAPIRSAATIRCGTWHRACRLRLKPGRRPGRRWQAVATATVCIACRRETRW